MIQIIGFAAVALLAASALWTENDPFVGVWKLDAAKSVIVDQMVVEAAGPGRYIFRFEGGPAETVVADGTDQPGLPGTTLSVTAAGPHALSVVRKKAGRALLSARWKLSADGRTLRDDFTGVQPDGSTVTVDYLYRRMSGDSGFVGVWESTTRQPGLKLQLQIRPFGDQGLSFVRPGSVRSVTFDGRDHEIPGEAAGLTASGRRQSDRALRYTEKSAGKVIAARDLYLSPDGATLTMAVHPAGQSTPNLLTFERE